MTFQSSNSSHGRWRRLGPPGRLGFHSWHHTIQPLALFWRLEEIIVGVAAQQRHAELHVGGVREVDRIPVLPDGEVVAPVVQVPKPLEITSKGS